MSDSMDDLYQDRILHHYQNPQHVAELSDAESTVEGFNPTCGDRVRLRIQVVADRLQLEHQTTGCAICIASASIMASEVNAQRKQKVIPCIEQVLDSLREDEAEFPHEFAETDISALGSVKPFPMRIKCATLPWTVLRDWLLTTR